jgi:hypothetical protein
LRIPRVELGEELVPPIRHRRREVGPILPLERKQGGRVVEAEQLKVWYGEMEVWCRFRAGSSVLPGFHTGGFPAHGLPAEKGTCTDLWRVSFISFFHVFLSLLNCTSQKYSAHSQNGYEQSSSSPFASRYSAFCFVSQRESNVIEAFAYRIGL